ncbi:hypothetical protein LCGC14_1708580 [marine sediment metagenome]|uniref:Uncharacterized protein n=1 Tax=marine sediment metagenome TaxID=412755 RepID=A0A0F9I3H5_9ZZZZ
MVQDTFTATKRTPVYQLNREHKWRFAFTMDVGETADVVDRISDERGSCLVIRLYGVDYLIDCNDLE